MPAGQTVGFTTPPVPPGSTTLAGSTRHAKPAGQPRQPAAAMPVELTYVPFVQGEGKEAAGPHHDPGGQGVQSPCPLQLVALVQLPAKHPSATGEDEPGGHTWPGAQGPFTLLPPPLQ